MKKIMFVCTGNICRSAMAHRYMQQKLKKLNKENYLISSCGTYATTGEKSTNNAKIAMKDYNVNLENHRSTNIRDIDIVNYDLVICMTVQHKKDIKILYPNLTDKVYTLIEYVKGNDEYIDIDDPWGFNIQIYKDCAKKIVENVDKLIKKLEEGE